MKLLRMLLSIYRHIQYKIYKRFECGTMQKGTLCTHTPYDEDINHGDVVHPCVRHIPEGYLGHKWWMVYTPYYAANDTTENPILCYGESESTEPPTHWIVAYQVQGQPTTGYNSDPTLFYENGRMYVMWRENLTDRCIKAGYIRATFGAEVLENGIGEVFGPLVGSKDYEEDAEVSPTFIRAKDGTYRCYAMHLRFHMAWIQQSSPFVKKVLNKLSNIMDILGIWSQQKGFGYAIWESDDITKPFTYVRTIKFLNCNKLYRPWHMDLFEDSKKLYAIIQTNQCNADIVIAESEDSIYFKMHDNPLMTNRTSELVGIYKPTGGVIGDSFYLYYTAQNQNDRRLNQLYRSICITKSCLV